MLEVRILRLEASNPFMENGWPGRKGYELMSETTHEAIRNTGEDFAALLEESLGANEDLEGSVIKGIVVAIENDDAVVDVGLKSEGRVALKEFALPGQPAELKVGDTVEVYLERMENRKGEAVLSREKARREESWEKLE